MCVSIPTSVSVVTRCICPRAEQRPDTVQLAGEMADVVLRHMDKLNATHASMQRKLDRERRKTHK